MKYRVFRTFGNPSAEKNKYQQKNWNKIIEKYGEPIKLNEDIILGQILEIDETPSTLLVEDLSGDYFELVGE